MTNEYSMLNLIQTILRWKKHISFAVLGIGALSAIILLFKPNYYKAETTFYAASPFLADPSPLGYESSSNYIYGGSADLDRLFSIVSSDEMCMHLIKKFDLYKHYGIDSTSSKGRYEMFVSFRDNFKISKSKYDALVLSVEDTDPKTAADIANEARNKTDLMAQDLVKSAQKKTINSFYIAEKDQENRTVILSDAIKSIKNKYALIEPSFQGRALAEEIVKTQGALAESNAKAQYYSQYETKKDSTLKYRAMAAGHKSKLAQLQSSLAIFNKGVDELKALEQAHGRASDQHSIAVEKERLLSSSVNSEFTTIHVISKAYMPEHKSRPKRAIIVLASMLIALLASILGILVIHSINQQKV
jgi:tyrosine-protein kinase Etk/Wzc